MKRITIIIAALLLGAFAAVAQPKAIGVRGGLFGSVFNGEISYEHWATIFDNDYDFLEAELGVFGGNGFNDDKMIHYTVYDHHLARDGKGWLKLYLPTRTACVLKKIKE